MNKNDEKQVVVNELHRNARKNFVRRKFIQKGINDTWQIDLVDMTAYKKYNSNFQYLLTVIDIFSKYAYAEPLKNKSGVETTRGMTKIFDYSKATPKNIHSDDGKEFFNKNFQDLMKKKQINHYRTYSGLKAAIVERFNRTLKSQMWQLFSLNGSYKWMPFLKKLLDKYNSSYHRTIKMKPSQVTTKKIEKLLLNTVYNRPKTFRAGKFKVGDFVRISKYKGIFDKGYTPNWSTEIFKISKIKYTMPITYVLEDFKNNEIQGGFYEKEIQKVKYNDVYLVEKVLKKRGNKVLVKWLGFDNSHNSWIEKTSSL